MVMSFRYCKKSKMAWENNISEGLELAESAKIMLEFLRLTKYFHLNQHWEPIEEYWAEEWHEEIYILKSLCLIRVREWLAMWRSVIILLI